MILISRFFLCLIISNWIIEILKQTGHFLSNSFAKPIGISIFSSSKLISNCSSLGTFTCKFLFFSLRMSSEELQQEMNNYLNAYIIGDMSSITQSSNKMHKIIDEYILLPNDSIEETISHKPSEDRKK